MWMSPPVAAPAPAANTPSPPSRPTCAGRCRPPHWPRPSHRSPPPQRGRLPLRLSRPPGTSPSPYRPRRCLFRRPTSPTNSAWSATPAPACWPPCGPCRAPLAARRMPPSPRCSPTPAPEGSTRPPTACCAWRATPAAGPATATPRRAPSSAGSVPTLLRPRPRAPTWPCPPGPPPSWPNTAAPRSPALPMPTPTPAACGAGQSGPPSTRCAAGCPRSALSPVRRGAWARGS